MRLIDADALKSIEQIGKVFEYECNELYGVLELIDTQPTVNEWIPCSERLPELYEDSRTSEIVLVLGYDKDIDYEWQAMGWYADETKQWYFAECKNTDKQIDWIDIIAWQPLPEPYEVPNESR